MLPSLERMLACRAALCWLMFGDAGVKRCFSQMVGSLTVLSYKCVIYRRDKIQSSTAQLHRTPLKCCNSTSTGTLGLKSDTAGLCSAGARFDMPLVTSRSTETHRAIGTHFSNALDKTEEKHAKNTEMLKEDTEKKRVHAI